MKNSVLYFALKNKILHYLSTRYFYFFLVFQNLLSQQ